MAFNWRKFPWTNLHDLNLDWLIQTVKTLENNLSDAVGRFTEIVNKSILNTLTGEGEFNVIKTGNVLINGKNVEISAGAAVGGNNSIKLSENGDVRISGNSVQLTGGTVVSDGAEQLTMHNPTSSTSMIANYNSGVLQLRNNQDAAAGVAVSPINTPADGGGDNSTFAANVGYVKAAVEAEASKLRTVMLRGTLIEANNSIDFDGIPAGSTAYSIIKESLTSGRSPILSISNVAGDLDEYFHLSRYDWNSEYYEFTSFEIQVPSTVVFKTVQIYKSSATYVRITK